MMRRYKRGGLLKIVRGSDADFKTTFRKSLGFNAPDHIMENGLASIRTLRGLNFSGARYLWAYLKLVKYRPNNNFNDTDFYLFGVTLRATLGVLFKTL